MISEPRPASHAIPRLRPGRRWPRLVALGLFLAAAVAAHAAVPRLEVEAPPELYAEAGRVRLVSPLELASIAELVGLDDPGDPIDVVLAPEGHPLARQAPPWVAGYADGERGAVVLMPRRVPVYPNTALDVLLFHEISHVLLHRAAGGAPVPRWFNEGVAMLASREWTIHDRSRALLGGVGGAPTTTEGLERSFDGTRGEIATAYAVASAMVHHLVQRHGPTSVRDILERMRAGRPFPEAFEDATGETVESLEASFWRRYRLWYRWVPFLTSGAAVWLAVTALALLAVVKRKAKDRLVRERWEREESRDAEPDATEPGPPDEWVM